MIIPRYVLCLTGLQMPSADPVQAMDIAGLSKLSADTLVLIVSILGFLVCFLRPHHWYDTLNIMLDFRFRHRRVPSYP